MAPDPEVNSRKVAMITGATSGIGKAFAIEFAKQQYDLIITGRRKKLITQVGNEIRERHKVSVRIIIADLMSDADVRRLLDIVEKEDLLEVLVNNAGYGLGKIFHKDNVHHQLDMVKVHIMAPVMLIHKVLPIMIRKQKGSIINVSSLAAFIPTRTNVMYTGTKAFLLNFTESLNLAVQHRGIHIQCLCPGFTHTDFHTKTGLPVNPKRRSLFNWMKPEQVVRHSLYCLKKGKIVCIPGRMNRLIVWLIPVAPRSVYYYFARMLQRESGFENHNNQNQSN